MKYLPVLSYPGETSPPDGTASEPKAHNGDAPAQLARAVPRPAKPPSGIQKSPSQLSQQRKPAKPVHAAKARSTAVYHVMERLLDRGASSDADLLQAVTNLSGDEFMQVAEERSLAGLCGSPRCANGSWEQKPQAHYKVQGRVVYNMEDELSITCSKKCQAVITMIAHKLGSEDAALYRFNHPAAAPSTPPATPPPALSNTVVERDPMQHVSSQHRSTLDATALHSMQQAGKQQAPVGSVQIPSKEGRGVGTRKRSQAGLQYAAGNAKVPIMLAEIKEKDPSAAEVFAAAEALRKQSMQSTAGDQTAAHAVDGFVPKARFANALSHAPVASEGPHIHQSRTQQVSAQRMATPDRHDSQCTSSSSRSPLSTSPDQAGGAEPPIPSGNGGLQAISKQQEQLQPGGIQSSNPSGNGSQQDASEQQSRLQQQQTQQEEQQQQTQQQLQQQQLGNDATDVPILSFEIDDAEGPLEGADNGLASQFGRLTVIGTDGQPEETHSAPSAGPHQSNLSQNYRDSPSQNCGSSSEDGEADDAGSEGTALSGDEDDPSTWLADPPPDLQNKPTSFGAIYMLLESWLTQSTRDYLNSETDAPRQLRQSQMLGTSQEMLRTMSTVFARVVPGIVKQMQIRVPRSTIEQHLHELMASMHFATPIPAIKDPHWQVFVLVLMKGLSIKRVFALQDTFESRTGLTALKSLLDAVSFTDEMFDALLEVLMEG